MIQSRLKLSILKTLVLYSSCFSIPLIFLYIEHTFLQVHYSIYCMQIMQSLILKDYFNVMGEAFQVRKHHIIADMFAFLAGETLFLNLSELTPPMISSSASLSPAESIVIIVSDFEAARDAAFLTDERISKLYVEYRFLDVPQEELETPFSLPKPSQGERIAFNFR